MSLMGWADIGSPPRGSWSWLTMQKLTCQKRTGWLHHPNSILVYSVICYVKKERPEQCTYILNCTRRANIKIIRHIVWKYIYSQDTTVQYVVVLKKNELLNKKNTFIKEGCIKLFKSHSEVFHFRVTLTLV